MSSPRRPSRTLDDLSFTLRQTSRIAGLRDDGLVVNDECSELSGDLKSAVNSAYAVFMQAIDPHLQKQFAEDGLPETFCHYSLAVKGTHER